MSQRISAWAVGWTAFAAVVMILMGIFHAVSGLVAIVEDDFYVVTREWVFEFSTTAWGWIHLIAGVVVAIAGFGLFTGNAVARVVGVIVAAISVAANFMWLPYYPVWSIIMIAIGIAIIWALTAHGHDLAREQGNI